MTDTQAGVTPAPPDEPDWSQVLRALKGSRNTLAGWFREMEGYGDEEMKRALSAAWNRPDPRKNWPAMYRRMADRLEQELQSEADRG